MTNHTETPPHRPVENEHLPLDITKIADPKIRGFLADPGNTEDMAKGYLLLGFEAESRNDWEYAVQCYQRVLRYDASDLAVRYFGPNNLAYSMLNLRQFKEAEFYCGVAIAADNDRHNAHKNLGLACEGQGKFKDAAMCFLNAARRNMADKRAWLHLTKLVTSHPEVLSESPDLADAMKQGREFYEAHGGEPRLN